MEAGQKIVEAAVNNFGRLDILVNNAGILRSTSPVETIPLEEWELMMAVNVTGVFLCTKAVLPIMKAKRSGKIVNISSGLGLRGGANNYMYPSAKAGLINFTRSLALTYARNNIQANCIAPGVFPHTEQMVRFWRGGKYVPMGRLGRAEELGPAVVFLCSELSNHMTGETLVVDGGGVAGGQAPTGLAPRIPL